MAHIHRGKHDPRRLMRRSRTLMLLCWPLAVLAAVLTVLLYWQSAGRLLALATSWRESFTAWAIAPGASVTFNEAWHGTLWLALETILRGVGWGIFGLTMAAPGLMGLGLAIGMIGVFRPAVKQYRQLRARVQAMQAALKLLAPMPDSCHIFLHKRIIVEDKAADTELILVSPGGVVVAEVRGGPGIIEGCVTDAVLYRRYGEGDVEKVRNPARPAVVGTTRLSNFFTSWGINARVTPCVLFVHPEASAYVHQPDPLEMGGRRTLISTCVMTDATSFWEDLGRGLASGRVLARGTVEQIVTGLRKLP